MAATTPLAGIDTCPTRHARNTEPTQAHTKSTSSRLNFLLEAASARRIGSCLKSPVLKRKKSLNPALTGFKDCTQFDLILRSPGLPRFFPRARQNLTQAGLLALPVYRLTFPSRFGQTVVFPRKGCLQASCASGGDHSGGTAPVFHGIPY
jgi:hypothetical protein